MAIRYRIAINLLTVGEMKIFSLTPPGSVTNNTFKPPLEHPNGLEKEAGIYTSISGPKEVHNSNTETQIF